MIKKNMNCNCNKKNCKENNKLPKILTDQVKFLMELGEFAQILPFQIPDYYSNPERKL